MHYLKIYIIKFIILTCFVVYLCIHFTSCSGIPQNDKSKNTQAIDWRKYRVNGPDSNRYVKLAYVSSQRYPIEKYGTEFLTDNKTSTFWSSKPGLNRGEWVVFIFDSTLKANSLKIQLHKHPISAQVHYFNVYVNDTLIGQAKPGIKFLVDKAIRKIKIEAGEVDGYNTIQFPTINDSAGRWKILEKTATQSYNSKAFAITELAFFKKNGKKIPIKVHPQYNVRLNMQGIVDASMKHTISDGSKKTALMFSEEKENKALVLHFNEIKPICGIRIWSDFTGSDTMGLVLKNPQQSVKGRTFTIKKKTSTEHIFRDSCFAGKIAQLNFIIPNSYVFLKEIQFFDGAKWYGLSQKMDNKQNEMQDSLNETVLFPLLDVYTSATTVKVKSDSLKKAKLNKNKTPNSVAVKKTKKSETYTLILRSNFSFDLDYRLKTLTMGKKNEKYSIKKKYTGNWQLLKVLPNTVKIRLIGTIIQSTFKDNKRVSVSYLYGQEIFATVQNKHIHFKGIGTLDFAY